MSLNAWVQPLTAIASTFIRLILSGSSHYTDIPAQSTN